MERLESQLELLFNYQEAFNIPSNIAAEAIDSLENIQQCLSSYKEDAAKLWNFYRLGIICLQQFVVANFIGPAVTEGLKLFGSISTDQIDKKLDTLESSDIKIAPTCTNQELLAVAKLILVDNCPEGTRLFGSLDWWACRCLWIQQQVLTERSKVIKVSRVANGCYKLS